MPEDTLNLKEAVREGLVAYSTALRDIHEGTLPAMKVGRQWVLDRADLEALSDPTAVVEPDGDDLSSELSDPVREWARAQAATAPPMSARDARLVAAIFRRASADRPDHGVVG